MTDPMDDLRQASADASGVEVLSPAARAVLTAFDQEIRCDRLALAAALRAAANYCPRERRILMTIADELEGDPSYPPDAPAWIAGGDLHPCPKVRSDD